MLRYQCHHLLKMLNFLHLPKPLLVLFDSIPTLISQSFLVPSVNVDNRSPFRQFLMSIVHLFLIIMIVDNFCLLMLFSAVAILTVTSKGAIDDTCFRCTMVKFFLMVIMVGVIDNRNSKIVFDTRFQ